MNKTPLIIGLSAVLVLIGALVLSGNKVHAPAPGMGTTTEVASLPTPFNSVSEAQFTKYLADSAVVIDVRTPQEYAQGTIVEKPLNIDFYKDDFKQRLGELDKTKTYFLYCRSGNRSGQAMGMMRELGFKNVYDLNGGIKSWRGQLYTGVDRGAVIADLLGKPSFVVIAGTYCPHCQESMPKYAELYKQMGERINVLVNVIDGNNGKRFTQDIPQAYAPQMSFKLLTGQECEYVPAWVVLDKDGNAVAQSCGAENSLDDAVSALNSAGGE
jgi:rhodanese-related sulfurtransferase